MQEIKTLHSQYNINKFTILDENFTLKASRVREFCQKVLEEDINFKFMPTNGVRLDTLNEDLLKLMKQAGFVKRMAVGIESGSNRVLKIIKKGITTELVREKIELMNRLGFKPIGFFILGFPTETRKEMQQTIDFAVSLKLCRAAFTCLLPLPGTEIYDTLLARNELPDNFHFENLTTDKVTYAPKGVTREELDKIRKRTVLKFHMRPKVIWDFLQDYSSFMFAAKKFMNLFIRRDRVI